MASLTAFHLENCPSEGGCGNWMNPEFKGGHDGYRCDKSFIKPIWGVRVCLSVCVCRGFVQDFEYWKGGTPKFGVAMARVYST